MSTTVVPQSPHLATQEEDDLHSEIEALCQLIKLGQGHFTLALVEYDLPRTCDKVIAEIRERFSATNIVEVALSPPPPDAPLTYNVLDQLKNVAQASSPDKVTEVLIITGLETLLPSTTKDNGHVNDELRRAIQPLNLGRNMLAEMFPCPVLLCLPKAAMEILLTSAPDIVSWKSGFFTFESDVQKVLAELNHEAGVRTSWRARWRLRHLTQEKLLCETKQLKALIADARMLPAEPLIIARLYNRLAEIATALGDVSLAQQSFAGMLRLARGENNTKLSSAAERGLRHVEKRQLQRRISLKHSAVTQQSFRGAAALTRTENLFGRETESQELLLQLTRVGNRFVTVWGETGCGKTSLVLTGIVPALEKQGYLSVVVREWEYPTSVLRDTIEIECGLSLSSGSLQNWLQTAAQKTGKTIIIVCDQFEQFFTKHPHRQERELLLKEIGECLNDFRLPCKFIFILREDYLGRMVELEKHVGDALDRNKRFYLSLFDQATASRVMRQLSDKAKLNWPEVFLNEVIKDLTKDGQVRPIELQLIGVALATLDINNEQAYSRAGRAEGLLTDYLQVTLESISENTRELQDLERILLVLIEEPHERLSLTAEEIVARSTINLSRVNHELNKLVSVNLVYRYARLEKVKAKDRATGFLYELMHDVLVDSVLRLTRNIQDNHRRAKKILTRALEDHRIKPHHTISLREQRLLRHNLSTEVKNDPKVKALLNRSLLFGIAKWITLGLLAPLSILIFVQSTFTHVTIEQDFDNRLVIRRGLPQFGFMPLIGNNILIDTGFTVDQLAPDKRSVVQGIYFWELDSRRGGAIKERRFYGSFHSSLIQSQLLLMLGHKDEELQKILLPLNEKELLFNKAYAAKMLAEAIKADPSLAKPAFDTLLSAFRGDVTETGYESVAEALAVAIKADPPLAKPAFNTLLSVLKENKKSTLRHHPNSQVIPKVAVAAIKADPSLAKPAFDLLLSVLKEDKKIYVSHVNVPKEEMEIAAAAIKADPSLARPAFDAILPALKKGKDSIWGSDEAEVVAEVLTAVIKADPSLARPTFDAILLFFKETQFEFSKIVIKATAAAIEVDPSLARPAFDAILPALKEEKESENKEEKESKERPRHLVADAEVLTAAIQADPSLAKPAFDVILSAVKKDKDSPWGSDAEVVAEALAAAIKADPSLARPAFDELFPIVKEAEFRLEDVLIKALAAAIKADPSLAKPAFDILLSLPSIPREDKDRLIRNMLARALSDYIAVNAEARSKVASQLLADYDPEIREAMIEAFAKYLAILTWEEAKSGRDPVQFLFDHLEGRLTLMPNGNANTYAVYRQAVKGAMAWWMASNKPEAKLAQATFNQRLEKMRDQEPRLYLRVAAWEILAIAADLRDKRETDKFKDFDN